MESLRTKLEKPRETSRNRDSPLRYEEENLNTSIFSTSFHYFVAKLRKCFVRAIGELTNSSPVKSKFPNFDGPRAL